jgi:hypothetical protein
MFNNLFHNPIRIQSNPMTHCSANISSKQRKTLRHLLAKESEIIEQCRKHYGCFADMMMQLQCVNHHRNPEERTLKCAEFIRGIKQLDQFSEDDIAVHNLPPASIQTALTCDCMCIQAACFRILYKWLPELDNLRMKRLKVRTLCSDSVLEQTGAAVEVCAKIEKIAQKNANDKASKPAS